VARKALSLERASGAGLCIVLADEEMVSDLNRRYLGRDGLTDVMAFGQQGGPAPLLGDVVICLPQARRQARPARHSIDKEICLLAIHGILHLLGWDDQTPADRRKMMRRAHEIWRASQPEPKS